MLFVYGHGGIARDYLIVIPSRVDSVIGLTKNGDQSKCFRGTRRSSGIGRETHRFGDFRSRSNSYPVRSYYGMGTLHPRYWLYCTSHSIGRQNCRFPNPRPSLRKEKEDQKEDHIVTSEYWQQ